MNSATGERIIWLTEHADFSTVMHELLGHAADEMKDLHPEEFAKVEQLIGRTLDKWTEADHEKFATWFERYLYEGHAPTPELVPVFNRAKQYMRVIYEQMRRMLGGRIPRETRDLFDHYLGGWDSENATRIAVNMGHRGPGEGPFSGALLAAQDELATLQKRNRTRRYNRTMDGMLDELGRLEDLWAKRGEIDEEKQIALTSEIVALRAEIVIRADKRVRNLSQKIADMEKALTRDPNNRRFSGAVESAKWMMDDRTRILKETFGEEYHALFDNREDLLANYLVQHGLVSPDFEKGTGSYYPMKLDEGFWSSVKIPMVPASNRVIGQVQKAMVGVHHQNEMIRWQAGDWSADPTTLMLAWSRASSYQFVLEMRQLLHGMGRKLSLDEQNGNLPDKGYVINLEGTPLSPTLATQTRGLTNTTTAENLDDGLFGDNEKLESSLKDFFENSVVDLDNLPPGLDLGNDNLRFVSKSAVHKIFRPVQLNLFGTKFDIASTAARFALIYANVPGYMITNLAGNLVFLTAQSPLWIPRAVVYSKMLANDAYFRSRVKHEGGMLPAFSAITRGRAFHQVTGEALRKGEQKWLAFESKVDEYPRMIAWMTEANKKGYYTKASMVRLLDGETDKTRRDREYVAERTNQHMIDFTYRVGDTERAILGRLFFIWPYVRGATALPFWYGKNYPARTAVIAQLGVQQREYQRSMLGELPPGREDLFPYTATGARGGQANVLSTRYFNPAGPVPDEIKLVSDFIASSFGREPDNLTARLGSLLNVNVENLIGVVTGRDAFGNDISLREQVLQPYGIADSLVPFLRYARATFDIPGLESGEQYTPRAFREGEGDTKKERFLRSVIRVPAQTVSIPWLNAAAQSQGKLTTEEKIKNAVAKNQAQFHAVEGKGVPYPYALHKQVAAKVIYDDRVYELEREQAMKAGHVPVNNGTEERPDWDFGYHADDYDKAVVAYAVMQQNFPEVLAEHPTFIEPNAKLAEARLPPRSVGGMKYMEVYVEVFNKVLRAKPGPEGIAFAAWYEPAFEKKQGREKLKRERARGVYRGYEAVRRQKLEAARRKAELSG